MSNFFKKLKASERGERLTERYNTFQAAYKPTLSMSQTESFPSSSGSRPQSNSIPVEAQFDSSHLTIGAGVAIFHLATARVVVCYDTVNRYYFLPKGRRDANEDTGAGAEREGYEESGYRNRLLPLPIPTRQPLAPQHSTNSSSSTSSPYITEPIWTQLLPVSETSQYILYWYIAETLPPSLDLALTQKAREHHQNQKNSKNSTFSSSNSPPYHSPMPFSPTISIRERIQLDVQLEMQGLTMSGGGERYYEPVRHADRPIPQAEERSYRSELVPWADACGLLGENSVSADVVRRGWGAVELRIEMEG